MLPIDVALDLCRAVAAQSGDELDTRHAMIAAAVERLLFELQCARDEAERYREQLTQWGIPAKRRTVRRLEQGGFEAGWSE